MTHSVEEALRISVDALGGLQNVGHMLRPEMDPILAGQWLSHCLTASLRDKLSLAQVALILRKANAAGEHAGFHALSRLCGYGLAEPITPEAEMSQLQKRAQATLREATDLSAQVLALTQKAGLKIEQ